MSNHEELAASISDQAATQSYTHDDDRTYFAKLSGVDAEARERLLTERAIVREVVRAALAAGHLVEVFDGEAIALDRSTDLDAIMGAIMRTDEDVLRIYPAAGAAKLGYVFLVYGCGFDVINDYSEPVANCVAPGIELAGGLSDVAA